jgi:hypothetical protein
MLLLAFLLGFLLGFAFGFRLPLSCHYGSFLLASEASLALSGLTNQRSTSVAAEAPLHRWTGFLHTGTGCQ